MNQRRWKGLLQKEWILMKWTILIYALLSIFIVFVGPRLLSSVFDIKYDIFNHTVPLVGAWLVLSIMLGYAILIPSLGQEMKQQEVWLHTPASMLQLVAAKAGFAITATGGLLLFNGALLSISFLISGELMKLDVYNSFLALVSVLIAIFFSAIFVMAVGFFFWAVFHIIRSYIGEVSYIITFFLFFISVVLWERLRELGLFSALNSFVPIKLTSTTFYDESTGYFFTGIVPGGVVTSIGSLLFYGIFILLLFVTGAKLFEKKVRL